MIKLKKVEKREFIVVLIGEHRSQKKAGPIDVYLQCRAWVASQQFVS